MQENTNTQVRETIERFRTAVANRDIQALGQVIAHEDNIVFFGSQAGDKQVGWHAIRQSFEEQFQETESIRPELRNTTIAADGDVAWVASEVRYSETGGRAAGDFDSRWTSVLRRVPDGWKIVQMHHSVGR